MGSDKALLAGSDGRTLVERVAEQVARFCGGVTLIGPADRYRHLPYPVLPDAVAERGPAGGILAALRQGAEWNLLVACDMPGVCDELFRRLIERAEAEAADCVIPISPEGQEHPLCALYGQSCREGWEDAVEQGLTRLGQIVRRFRVVHVEIENESQLHNVNTPGDWHSYFAPPRK
jgi:molybdopterin-guanine dinucleotide biosynthesis protein A